MSREFTGDELGAGVSIILVDTPPGRGPSLHRHPGIGASSTRIGITRIFLVSAVSISSRT